MTLHESYTRVLVLGTYSVSATLIQLAPEEGARLADPATGGSFTLRWWLSSRYSEPEDDPNYEDVTVVARLGDYLQVERGANHTTASEKGVVDEIFGQYSMVELPTHLVRDDMIHEVTTVKGVGSWNSLANLTARVARLETLMGLTPLPEVAAATISMQFTDQYQASFVTNVPESGIFVKFAIPYTSIPSVRCRGETEARVVQVGVYPANNGLFLKPAEDGTRIEWAVRGTARQPSESYREEGVISILPAGTTLDFVRSFNSTDDYCIFVSAVSGEIQVVTGITKSVDSALLTPAEAANATYFIIGRTQ